MTKKGYIHPVFNLHLVKTYRSSCTSPNFQNIPIRNKLIAKVIRMCFVARKGYYRGSFDFKAIEVNVAACYCRDPKLLEYCRDQTKDMHRDMAMECFMLKGSKEWWADDMTGGRVRYAAKNMFVFPQFYGSYYKDCARALWDAIIRLGLKTPDGVPLRKHLKRLGITKLGRCDKDAEYDTEPGTFEHHIKEVERKFWKERFPVYDQWKRDLYENYLEHGGFNTLTGFRVEGYYKRNKVINNGIQGSAFHCLLWVLIQLDKWLRKNHMKTKIIGQIHDSMELDIYRKELHQVVAKVNHLVEVELPKHFTWIIVPMRISCKVSKLNGNWYEQEKYERRAA
jgi:DNA polymerase-1